MFWNYIRSKVRDAVLAGVNDAAQELEGSNPADTSDALALLRARLQAALPAPAEANGHEEPATPRKRKT